MPAAAHHDNACISNYHKVATKPNEERTKAKKGQKRKKQENNKELGNSKCGEFENKMYEAGMFMDVPDDWHAGASDREKEFQRSLDSWVHGHKNAGNKAMAERLSKHIRYVTDAEFRSAFYDSVKWAYDAITKSHTKKEKQNKMIVIKVQFVASAHKSSAWLNKVAWDIMTSRIRDHGTNNIYKKVFPKLELAGCVDVDDVYGILKIHYDPNTTTICSDVRSGARHVLLCDDASYSGEQLCHTLERLIMEDYDDQDGNWPHIDRKKSKASIWYKGKQVNLYVVVPFVSTYAYKRFLELPNAVLENSPKDEKSRLIHHGTSGTLESGTQIRFERPDGARTLVIHLNPVAPNNVMKTASLALEDAGKTKGLQYNDIHPDYLTRTTLTTFNHKTPDRFSFFPWLRSGQLIKGGKFSNDNSNKVSFLNFHRRAYEPSTVHQNKKKA
jgi:hypothetical protein